MCILLGYIYIYIYIYIYLNIITMHGPMNVKKKKLQMSYSMFCTT